MDKQYRRLTHAVAPLLAATVACWTNLAHGLVVSDPAAVTQRAGEYVNEAARWSETIGLHTEQIQTWQREFEEFQQTMQKVQCASSLTQRAAGSVSNVEVGSALDTVDDISDIGSCFTDADQRTAIRDKIKEAIKKSRETEEAVDEVDESNDNVAAALAEMDGNADTMFETYDNVSVRDRNAELLRRAGAQARFRQDEAQRLRERQVAINLAADELRKTQSTKINEVEGMLEAQQMLMQWMALMSHQLSGISTAMNGQAVLLTSIHQVAVEQMEIQRMAYLADHGTTADGSGDGQGEQRGAGSRSMMTVTINDDSSITRQ